MLIMCLLTTASAFKTQTNVARFPDFASARDILASKESKVNTFAVEQAAAAVPADAWNSVDPTEIWLTLPRPDDAAATQKLLREKFAKGLRGLSVDDSETFGAMVGALSADFARCCEFGCLDDCCSGHTKARAVRAKRYIAALDDARAAQPCPRFHADTVRLGVLMSPSLETATSTPSTRHAFHAGAHAPDRDARRARHGGAL